MNSMSFFRVYARFSAMALLCFCLFLIPTFASAAMQIPDPKEKASLPGPVANALETIIKAAQSGSDVEPAAFDLLLEYSAGTAMGTGSRILPERDEGHGVFYYCPVPVSLQDVLDYTMNPKVPHAAIYPNSVRRGAWLEGSLADAASHFNLPASAVTQLHAKEYEQITPDENSGIYYAYTLNRLFALTPVQIEGNGKSALFQISVQNGKSENGLKGAILGPDKDWNYAYTGVQGSTLPMVGWAETNIYGAITINIWVEQEEGKAYLYSYKWLKAGWSGMNMVKTNHLTAGVNRYLEGLHQMMGSAKRPSPESLVQIAAKYAAMSNEEQIAALADFSRNMEALAAAVDVTDGDFQKVLTDGAYAASMSREDREAELIRLFVKQQLGLPFSNAAK